MKSTYGDKGRSPNDISTDSFRLLFPSIFSRCQLEADRTTDGHRERTCPLTLSRVDYDDAVRLTFRLRLITAARLSQSLRARKCSEQGPGGRIAPVGRTVLDVWRGERGDVQRTPP